MHKTFYNIFLLFAVITISFACTKYSSPRKVNRLLTQDVWKISSIYIRNIDMTPEFEGDEFVFQEDNDIIVTGPVGIGGSWDTGVESNPTNLQLVVTPIYPYYELNADWIFTQCTKNQMTLEVKDSIYINTLILKKVGT